MSKQLHILCSVLLQVPKCFVPVQIFWASPKIWGLHLVPLLKLLCQHKNQFYWCKSFCLAQNVCDCHNMLINFWHGTKILNQPKNWTALSAPSKTFVAAQKIIILSANHVFVWHKKFGPAQKNFGTGKRTRHKSFSIKKRVTSVYQIQCSLILLQYLIDPKWSRGIPY